MPSLVIDARMIDASGIGVYLRNILPYLATEFTVTLLGDPSKLQVFSWSQKVKILPLEAPIYSLKEQWALKTAIPPCDLFWSPHYNIPLLPIKAAHRVVTIHDTYHLAYRHTLSLAQRVFATTFLNAAVKLSERVITVSAFSKSEILRYTHASKKNIQVIPNGLNHETYKKLDLAETKARLYELLPSIPPSFILFVGNVKPHKNLKTLLKAYATLPPVLRKQHQLVIAGKKDGFLTPDSDLANAFKEDLALEADTFFTGYVPDEVLPLLYNSASLFVFPSVYEGFGLPPLEAMACGCPVVASTAASIREVCGEAALYFDPQEWKQLARQMEAVLTNEELQSTLIQAGDNQSKNYSWYRTAQTHLSVFRELLDPGKQVN
ncbi:hypothetical protein TH63_05880 [Rufibacter radiotolerans]|uniref:Glycosyltransferase n=1 Tax=Rufibacter radiotolerans TaxID=1379910 RepID=A0A0H4VNF4_9BACT|nr:glycosyltransferase family 1 protein [Rufibacter radiotolerans]AKQ45269.1 hypothetical protein TH63_05880 [Rufibacter radiotolerans]